MSQKRRRSPSPTFSPLLFKSDSIEDRSSKFIAVYSPTLSTQELQALPEFKNASHRIAAWRKPSTQRTLNSRPVLETGHDDDGEKYGGKTVEKVLVGMKVEGAVVVARWYGGVMLGPVRFDHIRNNASQAVRRWKESESEGQAKKVKVETEEREKYDLVQVLYERDQNIMVLRGLLAEKTRPASSSQSSGAIVGAKVPDYATLPLATLQKLEMVRDKTISWVLREIEKAEETHQKDLGATTPAKVPIGPSDGSTPAEKSKAASFKDPREDR
ncbi:hypothetical protein OEA41_009025 [Lepraria neglecta]|uniref:Impact N-terminal domain-containing protein n=1 Tax=Lepraria neglecta TaxID=209136 RepID=A0AAD9Z2G3_9LECA|nr:hypothetical protein OEA41_009025 [Lepraria neglecta]